jgi:FlaA1/EpsC-like NDP-sugar epimerase
VTNIKTILITGVCGTIGSVLIEKLLNLKKYNKYKIIGIDKDENNLFFLTQKYITNDRVKLYLCDIRNEMSFKEYFKNVDLVFHTAALKHVGITELSPYEAVQTNIIGTNNLITSAEQNNVKKFIFCSTDKAVNPTNVMGSSKLMAEKLLTSAVARNGAKGTIFSCIRFGNVMGSAGSVFPVFCKQIESGGPLTITDKNMTRFIMSISQATDYIIEVVDLAVGGEVFVPKMPSISVDNLADALIKYYNSKIFKNEMKIIKKIIGPKPGEKFYEELLGDEELRRTIKIKNYYIILPAFYNLYPQIIKKYLDLKEQGIKKIYNSQNSKQLTVKEIIKFIDKYDLIVNHKQI